jgi:dephospho-CoA kinase
VARGVRAARGAPPSNVHVRVRGRANQRYALLFRDYLRADERAREAWGEFKRRLARHVSDLPAPGQIKDPATDVLVRAADSWADHVGWKP